MNSTGSELLRRVHELNVANESLQAASERYLQLFLAAPIPCVRIDEKGTLLELNDAARRLLGLSPNTSRLRAPSLFRLKALTPVDSSLREFILQTSQQEGPLSREIWFRNSRAQRFLYEVTLKVLPQSSGSKTPRELLLYLQDRTEEDKGRKEKERHYRTLNEVLDSEVTGYWEWSFKEDRIYYSPAWCRMLGYEPGELEESPETYLRLIHPEDRDRAQKKMREYLESGKHQQYFKESRFRHKQGHWIWVICSGRVTEREAEGRPVRMTGCHVDISRSRIAEEKASHLLNLLERTNETARIGHWELDLDTREVFCSRVTRELFDFDPDECVNVEDCLPLYREPYRDLVRQSVEQAAESGKTFDLEVKILSKKNIERWIRVVGVTEQQGTKTTQLYGVFQDIDERKRTEEALRKSGETLNLFFSQSLHGFFLAMLDDPVAWNAPGADKDNLLAYALDHLRMTKANQAMLDQYGAAEEDFIGITLSALFAHNPGQARELSRALFDGGSLHLESSERKLDGTPIAIDGEYTCLYDEQGRITGLFGVQVDITDRKQVEADLLKLQRAVEQSRVTLVITDTDGQIEYVNDAFEKTSGYTREEALGQNPRILQSGETSVEEYRKMWQSLAAGGEWQGIFHNRRKDGSLYWESAHISAVKDGNGRVTHFLAVKEDITQRKELEDAIRQASDIIENMQIGLYVYELEDLEDDRSLRMIAANPASEMHNVCAVSGLVGGYIDEIFPGLRRLNTPRASRRLSAAARRVFLRTYTTAMPESWKAPSP